MHHLGENRSTTVRIIVLPLEAGNPVTKSKDMSDHGCRGTGRDCRNPAGGLQELLFLAQTGQADTCSEASFLNEGHQKYGPSDFWVRGDKG